MSGRRQPRGPAPQDPARPAAPAAARPQPAPAAPIAQSSRSATPAPAPGVTAGPEHRDSPLSPSPPQRPQPLPPQSVNVPAGWEEAFAYYERLYGRNQPPQSQPQHSPTPGPRSESMSDLRSIVHGERSQSPIRRYAPRPREDEEQSPEERKKPRQCSTSSFPSSEPSHLPPPAHFSPPATSRSSDSVAAARVVPTYAEMAASPRCSPPPTAHTQPAPAAQGARPHSCTPPPISNPRHYPPIVVVRMDDWVAHMAELARRLGHPANARPFRTGMRFFPRSEHEQRVVRAYLVEASRDGSVSTEWYCYAPLDERPTKVAILGLPADTDAADIVGGLRSMGFPATYARHIPTRRGRVGHTYYATLDHMPREMLQRLYAVEVFLCLPGIRIVAWRGRQGPAQCHRCQAFGHASANCFRPPRCVRCGGPHAAAECQRPREDPPTCANCGGTHTANDRRCRAFRREARKRNQRVPPPVPDRPGAPSATQAPPKAPQRPARVATQAVQPQPAPIDGGPSSQHRRRKRKRGPRRGRRSAPAAPLAHSTLRPPAQAEAAPGPQPRCFQKTNSGVGRVQSPPPTTATELPAVECSAPRAPPAPHPRPAYKRHQMALTDANYIPNPDDAFFMEELLDLFEMLQPDSQRAAAARMNQLLQHFGYQPLEDLRDSDAESASEMAECDDRAPPSTRRPSNTPL